MLNYKPHNRATARSMLDHYWLKMPVQDGYRISEGEIMALLEKKKREQEENIIDVLELRCPFQLEDADNFADHEDNDDEYDFEEEEEEKGSSDDRDSDMGSIIPVCDTSFNQ